jgi:hypothetical protein
MRLTLRNLLNYMDDMLEPSDAAEIRKKVEESQFASDLLQRTRTVVGRMRLGSPKVTGRGMGVDANTVSDYLDHVLDSEDVQEFEKICLESDIHLAEVAGCHQILALVLGEPASVDPKTRDRMYQLKQHRHEKSDVVEEAEPAAAVDATDTAAQPQPTQPQTTQSQTTGTEQVNRRDKPGVPDYLRDRRRMPLWSVIATILVAAALGAGLWMVFDPNNPISAWLKGDQSVASDTGNKTIDTPVLPDGPKAPVVPSPAAPSPVVPSPTPVDKLPKEPVKPIDKPDPVEPDTTAKIPDHIKLPVEPVVPKNPDAGLINPPKKPDTTPDLGTPTVVDPLPGDSKKDPLATDPTTTEPKTTDEPMATGPVEVGRFLSNDQLLIRKVQDENDWLMVPARSSLRAGDHVLALPTYRPTIALSAGVTLQVPGGTSLELLPPDADGMSGVRLYYGRLVLLNNGTVGTRFRIQLGDGGTPREGVITFSGPTSTAAIEVHREFRPGENPEDEKTPVVAELCASGGQIAWEEQGEAKVREEIDPKTHIVIRSDKAPKRIDNSEVFAWLETDDISKRDRLASPEMKKNFEQGRSVVLSLKELAAHRRFEVRSLAVRSLGHLNYFEPLVVSFDDPEQRANWQPNFESLREAITRGTVVSRQMREAFERRRGDDASGMYRMIWGYSPEQLSSGSAEQLVEDLMHDDLGHRVLAFTNLLDITGLTLLYRADETALRRRAWVRRWKEKLDAGEIKHRAKGA